MRGGAIELRAPRVNDKRIDEESGQRMRFRRSILPPYVRRSPKVSEVLPLLYLHGLSSGDFMPALEEFFGSKASLSATTIARLTERWRKEREEFMRRDLSKTDYVYAWVDGIHTKVRLEADDRRCCLVWSGRGSTARRSSSPYRTHIGSLTNVLQQQTLKIVGMLCVLHSNKIYSEDHIAAKLGFGSAEAMYVQLKNYRSPD